MISSSDMPPGSDLIDGIRISAAASICWFNSSINSVVFYKKLDGNSVISKGQ
jgi:hypothetical protein